MANTIAFAPPIPNVTAAVQSGSIGGLPAASHIHDADVVVLTSGQLATAAVGAHANIAGIALHDSNATFFDATSGSLQGVFGFGQQATTGQGLSPQAPGWVLFVTLAPSQIVVEMNLPTTTGWVSGGTNQANIGTAVGLNIDGTTGYFYADDQQGNPIGHIVGKAWGPGLGIVGDLAARVFVAFDASGVLALVAAH